MFFGGGGGGLTGKSDDRVRHLNTILARGHGREIERSNLPNFKWLGGVEGW